jgi:hypothetical protein
MTIVCVSAAIACAGALTAAVVVRILRMAL